ncbi:CLUMA_CG012856, isoform A [Clunio marinus]|uniref:CLUMA_CG012856, isoform A n=1 Tax=Clunio marinus TaxID=568069 RepID=A0A1J1IM42_9DIPT|nr:CLUMA_CG012856, isoform A [Clunio marinus]
MSGRGQKRRGRPPKTPAVDKKYNLLKKPKYLQNDSRLSTPSASRASSPQDSEESFIKKKSDLLKKRRGRPPTKNKRGGNSSYQNRRSYNSPTYNKTDYHYGSDFGDSTEKSDDEMAMSHSDSPESFSIDSDSDFSLSSYSNIGQSSNQPRSVTPEPVWIKDDIEIPPLELPKSSDDLIVPKQYVLRSLGIYEVLRRYRNLVRLSPFRVEDFCAALMSDEQSTLFTEIHIALLKAILREEDSQQTHFGPLDQKDSINIGLYLIDTVTWPEVLRMYVESDPSFSRPVLDILSQKEYPYASIDDRLTVLQFLTDQFLTTTFIRDDMIQEGPIHYDDHCRVCHRLGNLLCCETCPAVYHLECVDPPLENVPTEDWQCNICKSHSVSGVNDCISNQEKQGTLCRHEHFGFDRHARKYWFVCRRLFIETEDGSEVWYFTTMKQFENVIKKLDSNFFEKQLCKIMEEYKEEIVRQMKLTETLTDSLKGNKKSYLEVEHEKLGKDVSSEAETENGSTEMNGNNNNNNGEDVEQELESIEMIKNNQTHLTRSRTNQLYSGTFFFKLGMENSHKEYCNQFTTNPLALNKPQKNEERDKKRHLSHKFSLTQASEFKWGGLLNGTHSSLIAIFKQTLLTFESSITQTFMHCNWCKLRKSWLNAVSASNSPRDFVKVLVTLQSCFKNVIYANVWHEQLGHVHLYRVTSNEREERKKIEKREKREENEEERNRLAYNYVKYSLGLRHQVWKQKGEEYRIHGQWGWLWSSINRRSHQQNKTSSSRIKCRFVVIKDGDKKKVLKLKRQTFDMLESALEYSKKTQNMTNENLEKTCEALKSIEIEKNDVSISFEGIDISQALKAKTRIVYPKIGKRSTLDSLLERREKLRDDEMKVMKSNEMEQEIPANIISSGTDVTSSAGKKKESGTTITLDHMLQGIADNKSRLSQRPKLSETNDKCIEIISLMSQLNKVKESQSVYKCFSEQCRNATTNTLTLFSTEKCFSALCRKESQLKENISRMLQELRDKYMGALKKGSILHQKLSEAKNIDLIDILKKYQLNEFISDEYYEYDVETCLNDIASALEEFVEFDESLFAPFTVKMEAKIENEDENEEPKPEIKVEEDPDDITLFKLKEKAAYVKQPNRRFLAIPKPPKKETEIAKELDSEGNEKIYAATATAGRIYLKKVGKLSAANKLSGSQQIISTTNNNSVKYPAITTYNTVKNTRSVLILPKYELEKCARRAGKYYVNGFNHQAKSNNSVWPYPCSRPFFKTCWIYRTLCANSFSALGLQLRILWTCLRWDDMQTKQQTTDGKNQVTTETEIVTTELLKHRNIGMFMEQTQYFRRRIVIPLELPKTVREVTSIRSGLRKRKRAESPRQTDPQVSEEWIDEDKLELWEIRQYVEKQERANIIPTTRTSTGKLPLPRQFDLPETPNTNRVLVSRITSADAKEKMEQQLRLQRDANNKKRAEDLNKQATPQYKTIIRKVMLKNPDGTTRFVNETTTQQITPRLLETPQKIQVMRGPDGKMSVRGLQPNQKLVQTADGKYLILPSNHSVVGGKVVSQLPLATSTPVSRASTTPQQPPQKVLIRAVQPKTAAVNTIVKTTTEQKESPTTSVAPTTPIQKIITSSGQVITQQIPSNIISSANFQQLLQRGNVTTGQKIVVQGGLGGVQKLLVTSQTNQQVQPSGEKRIIIQNACGQQQQYILQNQNNTSQQPQQFVTIGGQKLLLQTSSASPQIQQIKTVTSPVQQQQQPQQAQPIQFQIQEPQPQQQQQQIVVQHNGNNLSQQLAQGKIQVLNLNGQQVLVKSVGNNQSIIVGQVKTSTTSTPQVVTTTTIKSNAQPPLTTISTPSQQQIVKSPQASNSEGAKQISGSAEDVLLGNHPPGTIIKCVTAQVMQTPSGPRIVLQGLQGSDISPQQSQILQQQVKQQLMKAQESSGKQGGVIGPTKMYLAITPQQQPPPLTPVNNPINDDSVAAHESVEPDGEGNELSGTEGNTDEHSEDPIEGFVVTQEYIQNTIKNVLRQGNLNPEIEEKLLTLQRYQEKQAKGEPLDSDGVGSAYKSNYPTRSTRSNRHSNVGSGYDSTIESDEFDDDKSNHSYKGSRRGGGTGDDDEEWVIDTPRKYIKKADREKTSERKTIVDSKKEISENEGTTQKVFVKTNDSGEIRKNIIFCQRAQVQSSGENSFSVISGSEESERSQKKGLLVSKLKFKASQKSNTNVDDDQFTNHKLQAQLLKHKESLKRIILKKRDILEKDLYNEIQKELSAEMAVRIKIICAKQKVIENKKEPSKYMKKKFYIGCDLCSNWFHGECVGISEEESKIMTDFICSECEHAKDSQELFCLCRTPYDQSQFYICCDKCQDWFHGTCVGILQSEAEFIDEYICPNCQKNNSINFANMKTLEDENYKELLVFLKDIQCHKSAWPFIDPVDANEVPDYYNVIRDPMDLKQIERKIQNRHYTCLADIIKDMTKVFDNCRYYNHCESTFYKCAEELEKFFIQKLNNFRDYLISSPS